MDVPGLDRGDVIGRYVVLDVIGQGGMGIIYAAFDPELDRKVALKLLQAGSTGSGSTSAGSQAWLLREAQAMARLSHPNVIAVHDVGTFGDRVFIAMELVEGVTLREWFKDGKRAWRDVIAVMRAAGAGLAAAHRVGLVHRDFKPENVLVGNDGRVRVMDFGLARLDTEPTSRDSDLSIESRSPLTDQLTEAGTVMGTPAYMAPEIMDGHGADARSDQFAFGVALYEALYRTRPFDKGPKRSPKMPPDSDVPTKLARTVMRAVAIDPAARFASMDELLAELAIDPNARRRQVAITAAFGVIALGVAGSIVVATRSSTALCTGTDRALAGAWDPHIKAKIHTAFAATKKPWAEAAFASLTKGLDGYTKDWVEATVGNCEATRIRGEQTERVFEARQLCLDQRLEEVRALGKLLQEPTDTLVEKADKIGDELEPLSCEATTLATTDLAAYTKISMTLATAHAQIIAGQYIPGLGAAQSVVDDAKRLKADDLVAEGLLLRGTVMQLAGNIKDGNALLAEATWTAMRGHYDLIVAKSALSTALVQAQHADSLPTAQLWLDLATASAGRFGAPPTMKLQMVECQGAIQAQRGELTAAIATHTQGLDLAKQVYGANSPMVWGAENQLATTMGRAGAWVAAVPHLEHALALREAAVGPDHPDVALIVSNLGACYDHAGDRDKALAAFKRAFAMKEKAYGPNSPFLVGTLNNIADFESRHGQEAAALADITRAKAIAIRAPGTSSPLYHVIATTYAEVLSASKPIQARAAFDEVLALEIDLKSPELGTTLAARGKLELDQHQYAAAAKFEERSIAAYEATGGVEDLSLWKPLAGLAVARRALDPKAEVKPLFDRAVAIGTKAQISAEDMKSIVDAR
jgi:eukaryotic-like serine/threonine-protein kinase